MAMTRITMMTPQKALATPQNAGDNVNLLEKIIFTFKMLRGPVAGWGLV